MTTKSKLTLKKKDKKRSPLKEKDIEVFVQDSPLEKTKAQAKKESGMKLQTFNLFLHEIESIENLIGRSVVVAGRNSNKSEVVRAAIVALANISDKQFKKIMTELPIIKRGRK